MPGLDATLKLATVGDNWSHVIHRCAWCNRVFDENGAYATVVAFDQTAVATHGMCPACAACALTQIAARKQHHVRLAA